MGDRRFFAAASWFFVDASVSPQKKLLLGVKLKKCRLLA